ncbi:hypothetical protein F5883DRAFT_594617, partial [Diaporthe sp. PMI_573]
MEPGHSGYESHVGAAARDELSTAGRSGYNSVGTTARRATIATNTDGRSGYNSVDVTSQAGLTDFTTDGRSGYNSVEVAEHKRCPRALRPTGGVVTTLDPLKRKSPQTRRRT